MNEKYLSRGKRKDNGAWIEGYLIQGNKTYIATIEATNYMVVSVSFMASIELVEVIPETVIRCTGLNDKNGKLIFEGDIVKADGYIFFVKFGKCGGVANDENYGYMGYYLDGFDSMTKDVLWFGLRNDICYFTDIEIIGNIHDDEEMLEVER